MKDLSFALEILFKGAKLHLRAWKSFSSIRNIFGLLDALIVFIPASRVGSHA